MFRRSSRCACVGGRAASPDARHRRLARALVGGGCGVLGNGGALALAAARGSGLRAFRSAPDADIGNCRSPAVRGGAGPRRAQPDARAGRRSGALQPLRAGRSARSGNPMAVASV